MTGLGSRKSKTPVFRSKPFSLYVVVPAQQWSEYEAFVEHDSFSSTRAPAGAISSHHDHSYISRVLVEQSHPISESASGSTPKPRCLEVARKNTAKVDSNHLFLLTFTSSRSSQINLDPCMTQHDLIPPSIGHDPVASRPLVLDTPPVTIKQGHAHSSSVSSMTTKSPPTKQLVTSAIKAAPLMSCSTDCNRLWDAL